MASWYERVSELLGENDDAGRLGPEADQLDPTDVELLLRAATDLLPPAEALDLAVRSQHVLEGGPADPPPTALSWAEVVGGGERWELEVGGGERWELDAHEVGLDPHPSGESHPEPALDLAFGTGAEGPAGPTHGPDTTTATSDLEDLAPQWSAAGQVPDPSEDEDDAPDGQPDADADVGPLSLDDDDPDDGTWHDDPHHVDPYADDAHHGGQLHHVDDRRRRRPRVTSTAPPQGRVTALASAAATSRWPNP